MLKNQTQLNIKTNLSPELYFLIACCQADPSKDLALNAGTPVVKTKEECNALIGLAHQHGILPLVYKTLKRLSEEEKMGNPVGLAVPNVYGKSESATNETNPFTHLLSDLKHFYMSIVQKNMLMTSELLRIMKLLEENNIEALAFKGPALAQMAYGDITLRQYGDLDILVHKKDFRNIASMMQEKGYSPHYPIETFTGDKVMFEMNNDCPFYDRNRGLAVEIHWDFFRKLALPTERFTPWENTITVTINGQTVQTLSPETHLLYHSLHGAKHVWERLEWIVDIDRFIRSTPTLNWDKTVTMAKGMGAEKMFFSGIALAQKYFHTPLPDDIRLRCQALELEPFIAYVESELGSDSPAAEGSLTKLSKVIGLRDNLYYKTMTLLAFLFRPGINERRSIILPDSLFWLYWLLRPVGMAYRFIFCRTMKLCKTDAEA